MQSESYMKILVTGGAGFIASHIADAYIEVGHDVVVVDDLSSGRRENIHPQAVFYPVDIRSADMAAILAKERPQVINHHAAQMDVRRSVVDPLYDANVNILGFLNLLEQARPNGLQQVIFASTGGAIYGEQERFPAAEDHLCRPISPYGVSKFATEKYLHFYHEVYGLQYTVLRYANVYGPRQNPHGEAGVVAIFCQRLLKGEQASINGDGQQTRDFVYVGDVVQANLKAVGRETPDIFNIGTGIETTITDIFLQLRTIAKSDMPELHAPAKPGEQQRSVIACDKAARLLGWQPQVSLVDGLQKTFAYFSAA